MGKNQTFTIGGHLKRYHREWLEKTLAEARKGGKEHVIRELETGTTGNMGTIRVPISLPICEFFQKYLPFGTMTDWSFEIQDLLEEIGGIK